AEFAPPRRLGEVTPGSGPADRGGTPAAPRLQTGPQDSATSNAVLAATAVVMRNDSHAAVTWRRIAEEAGVKPALVYYYFHTMADLLPATCQRRTMRALAGLEEELAGDRPVEAIWQTMSTRVDAKLSFEFVALANHHEGIREEVARYMIESRRMQA